MRHLTRADLESLALGAAILGTGGGGDPYLELLRCRELLGRGVAVPLIDLDALADDACIVSVGGVGAPGVASEKLEQGEENLRALRAVEATVGCTADALIAGEIGGGNALVPVITAAQAGIGIVDADGMGRAFPEMQMTTFSIYGHRSLPAALADDKGNVVVFREAVDEAGFERMARASVVAMGGTAGCATAPMTGAYVKRVAVPATVTLAIRLGAALVAATDRHEDPVAALLAVTGGAHLLDGRIVDLARRIEGGFAVGEFVIEGTGPNRGDHARVVFQNEFLLFARNDVVEACVPDLVVVLDRASGRAISTESLRFGQRIAVLGLPCHPLLRTPAALPVVGPAAFALGDIECAPLAGRRAVDAAAAQC